MARVTRTEQYTHSITKINGYVNKERVIFFTILASFLLCNIFLLVVNHNLQDRITLLNDRFALYQKEIQLDLAETVERLLVNQKLEHPDIESIQSELHFAIFIPERSCAFLTDEISYLNKLFHVSESHFRAYLIADSNTLTSLESYGADFPYKIIDPNSFVTNSNYYFDQPVSALIDSNGIIQRALVKNELNPQKNEQFYQEIISYFTATSY